MVTPLGDNLLRVASEANDELLLVAPYIKLAALLRVLDVTSPTVSLRVVTRWRLDELAAGVSDIAIWPVLSSRAGSELWLQPSLHAKYYRADGRSLLGSANLTGAGMGWSASANLELLVEHTPVAEHLLSFERQAFQGARRVDDALYSSFKDALEELPPPPHKMPPQLAEGAIDFAAWRPCLRYPHDLWRYYSGEQDTLTTASREAAVLDLAALDPPCGLTDNAFRAWIALQLRQHPEVQAIERYGLQSRRFGEMRELMASLGAEDGAHAWQTWIRWLSHFAPSRFRFYVANYSEIFETIQTQI